MEKLPKQEGKWKPCSPSATTFIEFSIAYHYIPFIYRWNLSSVKYYSRVVSFLIKALGIPLRNGGGDG
jgi:hypothetical protein